MHVSSSEFDPVPTSVAAARRFVRAALEDAGAGEDGWLVAQLVSELATNAILHAATRFVVRVEVDPSRVRVEVVDGRPHVRAVKRRSGRLATTGRGLRVVERLGDAWGVRVEATTKAVWCEIERGISRDRVGTERATAVGSRGYEAAGAGRGDGSPRLRCRSRRRR